MPYALALQSITNLLKNKWFWIVILTIVIALIIRKNWYNLQQLTAPTFVEPTKDDKGNTIPVTQARQKQLRAIASAIYLDIHDVLFGFGKLDNLVLLNACTDSELLYIANYYASVLNKANKNASLYKELDDKWLPSTDLDDKVCLRLAQMGKM